MIILSVIIPTVNILVLLFLIYLLWQTQKQRKLLDERESELVKKETKADNDYHLVVESTHQKERKIIEDATKQASAILTNTKYVSDSSKATVEQALQKMISTIQQETITSSNDILSKYKNLLVQVSGKSIDNFGLTTKQFEADLQKQMQDFRNSILPGLQKELDAYKLQRFQAADKVIENIIQQVSQKVFSKSIPLEDHKNLILESLEKARKEGVFD